MNLKLTYTLRLLDPHGHQVRARTARAARSFLLAFLQHIQGALDRISINIIDVTNTSRSVYPPSGVVENWMNSDGPIGDTNVGPVVGTGTTAPATTDYALQTQIAHGNGAGQLSYQETAVDDVTYNPTTCTLRIRRNFNNNSGAPITINEIGLYCNSRWAIGTSAFCLIRDLLAAPFTVPNGSTAQLEYTLQTTV